jgi:outer membrane protein assembly factor BamD (BamD/ComL family)
MMPLFKIRLVKSIRLKKRKSRRALLALSVITATGCSVFSDEPVDIGPTLSDIQPTAMPAVASPVPQIDLSRLTDIYRSALEVAEDPAIQQKIRLRLAGLEMLKAEEAQAEFDLREGEQKKYYGEVIELHQQLLSGPRPEGVSDADYFALKYQLAKAYAMDGRMAESDEVLNQIVADESDSGYRTEALFRQAEKNFSEGRYRSAEQGYRQVMAFGAETPFYKNAIYMNGWSRFKLGRYEQALESFTLMLDDLETEFALLEAVRGANASLVQDTLHVMGLAFSYLEGAKSISDLYSRLGERRYEHLLYRQLSDFYLGQKRYRDSADTNLHFVEQYPVSDYAPAFAEQAINIYRQGNFPSEVLPAKANYVESYGVHSQFWAIKTEEVRESLKQTLYGYIQELAEVSHYQAQQLTLLQEQQQSKNVKAKKLAEIKEREKEEYLTSARWYQEFLDTFPNDEQAARITFLMAEALFEAPQLPDAFDAYETVAYQYQGSEQSVEAAYSAVLTSQRYLESEALQRPESEEARQQWQQKSIDTSLRFADVYQSDQRAPAVLLQASQAMFSRQQLPEAIMAASRLTRWPQAVEREVLRSAWLVVAQGSFDLSDYERAEDGFLQVLSLMEQADPQRESITQRLAASVYKIAEQQVVAGELRSAVDSLLRVTKLVPSTTMAGNAGYDAVNHLMDLEDWPAAEQQLLLYQQRYPSHPLINTVPAKLIVIYEAQQEWKLAAEQLLRVASTDSDSEVQRQSLFLAAEYYQKGGDLESAIVHYRTYAHQYALPFDQVMEARFQLQSLYQQQGNEKNRRYWLKKLKEGDHKAENSAAIDRTDRSRYLGAYASSVFANDEFQAFRKLELTLPLKKSLKKKKAAFDRSITLYQALMEYQLQDFTTLANFRIGAMYGELSRALMDSQRPKNLDALALEQYEILLEEQAYPFEEQAIDVHLGNVRLASEEIYTDWVRESYSALAELLPARFNKKEKGLSYSDVIH